MSVAAAAVELGVSRRQVARLARAGEVVVAREIGDMLLLDAGSVHRRAQLRPVRGRPWNEDVAWAALTLLSGEDVDWIPAAQMARLKHRLRRSSAQEVAFLARRRAAVHRMRGWAGSAANLSEYLVLTGASALVRRPVASKFGLAASRRGIDGYVLAEEYDGLVDHFGLIVDGDGDITVRAVTIADAFRGGEVPLAAVAVDLMDSLDTRERSAGTRVLQNLLDDVR